MLTQSDQFEDEKLDQVNEAEQSKAQSEIKDKQQDAKLLEQTEYLRRQELQRIQEDINVDSNENNFPNKSSLIVNAIMACLEDEKSLFNKLIFSLVN